MVKTTFTIFEMLDLSLTEEAIIPILYMTNALTLQEKHKTLLHCTEREADHDHRQFKLFISCKWYCFFLNNFYRPLLQLLD